MSSLIPHTITHPRGAAFAYGMSVQLAASTWAVVAHLRKSDDTLVAALTATLTPVSGSTVNYFLRLVHKANQSAWPIDKLNLDVKLTASTGEVIYTTVAVVDVKKVVTHD